MQLSDSGSLRSVRFWHRIDEIQTLLEVNDSVLADYFSLKTKDFVRMRDLKLEVPAYAICTFADRLEIDPLRLYENSVDLNLIQKSPTLRQQPETLPSHYQRYAFGSLSTPKSFIDHFVAKNGYSITTDLFRYLQVSPKALADSSTPVNLDLTLDLFRFMKLRTRTNQFLSVFGARGALAARSPVFDDWLSQARNYHEFYELLLSALDRYVEKNFNYFIEETGPNHCVFSANPKSHVFELCDHRPKRLESLSLLCLTRPRYLELLPTRVQLKATRVSKIGCCLQGDTACRYRIEFPN